MTSPTPVVAGATVRFDPSDPVHDETRLIDQRPTATSGRWTSPARLLLLRHAETAAPDRYHGAESDIGLGARGRLQAERAGEELAASQPDALYCSAMRRARETAELIGLGCGLVPQVVPALRERIMGTLSGALRAEAHPIYEAICQRWEAGDLEATHPGAESFAAIRARVVPAFVEIAGRHSGGTAVVVAHGVVIRVLVTTLVEGRSPADFERVPIEFVGVHELQFDGRTWREARYGA